jgi:parvulin-like peptidyl-prolyl isomerase
VARDFGADFASGLAALPTDRWSGPVRSSYGFHLVRVTAVQPATMPPLQEVRKDVEREWDRERRERLVRERYAAMRAGYQVVIEPTPAVGTL